MLAIGKFLEVPKIGKDPPAIQTDSEFGSLFESTQFWRSEFPRFS